MSKLAFPPVVVESLNWGNENFHIEGHKAIVNPSTGHVYDIVSDKYKLVKHEEVLENVEEEIFRNPLMGKFKKTVSFFQEGARMRARYRFEDVQVEVQKGDFINPTIEVFNSYDRSVKHRVNLNAFRLVCTNGMVVGKQFMHFQKRHMPDLYLEEVKEALKIGFTKLEIQTIMWRTWADKILTMEDFEKVIKKLDLNGKETLLLMEEQETSTKQSLDRWKILHDMGEGYQEERDAMNWWVFFNILTQFTTHRISSENRRLQLEGRIQDTLY